jgi:hypothetical protein
MRLKPPGRPVPVEIGAVRFMAVPALQLIRDLAQSNARRAARSMAGGAEAWAAYGLDGITYQDIYAGRPDPAAPPPWLREDDLEGDDQAGPDIDPELIIGHGMFVYAVELARLCVKSIEPMPGVTLEGENGETELTPDRRTLGLLLGHTVPGTSETYATRLVHALHLLSSGLISEGKGFASAPAGTSGAGASSAQTAAPSTPPAPGDSPAPTDTSAP